MVVLIPFPPPSLLQLASPLQLSLFLHLHARPLHFPSPVHLASSLHLSFLCSLLNKLNVKRR